MSVFDEAASQRQQLGAALRSLRQGIDVSGLQFGRQTGLGQSKVSRVELGQQVPSTDDLDRWLDATGADEARRAELHQLREAAATEAVAWRRHHARGLVALQEDVAAVEASAGRLCYWHPTLVPGILQTPAYARAVYRAYHMADPPDLAATIAKRMDRQALLYDQAKRFEIVIGEAALRWRPGPADLMLGQLDRLHVIAELPNVALGILPFGEVPVWRSHHFALYDEREDGALVHVEQLGGESNYRDPEDVALHAEAFKRLLDLAAVGPDALAILDRLAADLR